MSYVIQNFYDSNRKLNLTPRFKFLFFMNNLEKFFFFFKINTFSSLSNKLNLNKINNFNIFFKYFFSKQLIKFFFQLNLNLVNNYNNNVLKSSIFIIFYNFNKFFNINKFFLNKNFENTFLLFNFYFLSIKTINIKINNNFYKNLFFYFMFINSFIWFQYCNSFKFYLNFIFINYTLKSFRFYNGHFLRIYNY